MTSVLEPQANPIAETVHTLTEAEMLAKATALPLNPEFREVFEAEMDQDGYASRDSAIVTWIGSDDCREVAVYRRDRVYPDGTVTRVDEVHVSLPKPGEDAEYREALAALFARVLAAGVAEGQASA